MPVGSVDGRGAALGGLASWAGSAPWVIAGLFVVTAFLFAIANQGAASLPSMAPIISIVFGPPPESDVVGCVRVDAGRLCAVRRGRPLAETPGRGPRELPVAEPVVVETRGPQDLVVSKTSTVSPWTFSVTREEEAYVADLHGQGDP